MTRFATGQQPALALIQFPGSNCDADCRDVFKRHFNIDLKFVWHSETSLPKVDGVILPGGFSYGDYLRSGALASHSPIVKAVKEFASKGGAVLGICNGFQILVESGLLPGALIRNVGQKFRCSYTHLSVRPGSSSYQKNMAGRLLRIPIAHGDGRFYVGEIGLKALQDRGQIVFQYANEGGGIDEKSNPNGSLLNIAGIVSENGRVLGMMPHPERAAEHQMGSSDGVSVLQSFLASFL